MTLNKTDIPCEEREINFSSLLFATVMIGRNLLTQRKYSLTSKSLRKLEIPIEHDRENYRETTVPYLEQPGHHFALTKDTTSCPRNRLGRTIQTSEDSI